MSKKAIFIGIAGTLVLAVLIVISLSAFGTNPLPSRQQATAEQKSDAPSAVDEAPSSPASGPSSPGKAVTATSEKLRKADMVAVSKISLRDQDVLQRNKPIVVSFSAPMVQLAELESLVKDEDMPFILDPPVEGQGRWLNQSSFAFVAAKPGFDAGQEYFLRFRDDLKALDGKPARYFLSFRTQYVSVRKFELGFLDKSSFELPVYIQFSTPVSVESLTEHLTVKDSQTGEALEIEMRENLSSAHRMRIKLGKEREAITFTLRKDSAQDKAPLGLASLYENKLRPSQAVPAAQTPRSDRDSKISIGSFNSWEDSQGVLQARFYLSKSLAPHAQKDFIKLSPDLPYTLSSNNSSILIREGLEPGMSITLTLNPGLVDDEGRTLKKVLTRSQTIEQRRTSVRFNDEGHLLTPAHGGRIGITMCNADQISVQIFRQYENNLPLMSLRPEYFVTNLMRDLYYKQIRIKGVKKNEMAKRAIDLAEMTKGRPGVYRVVLTAYKEEKYDGGSYMSYESSAERLVVISDIGAMARVFPSGISVFATSLSTAEPLADAVVKVYSRSNQLIAYGKAGADGVYLHQRTANWDKQLAPNVVTVQAGLGEETDLTFLPLDYQTQAQQSDKGERAYLDKGYEAFVYTPRGVFRPGEKVDLKAFVRDKDQLPPTPFPILFKIVNSRNTEIARSSATLSTEGGADFSFTLPASAPTGDYYARVEVPGQSPPTIGSCAFKVEDFVPPRLEVDITPKGKLLQGDSELPVSLSGQYLFGAPGAGLKYELGYKVSKKSFQPQGFEGYAFGDYEKRFSVESNLKYITGTLDDDGLETRNFKAPEEWKGSYLLNALLVLSVQEDGGRWVSKTSAVDYFPKPYLLGLKNDTANPTPGKDITIRVAAVNADGGSAEAGPLSVEISRIQSNWHTVYRDGRNVYNWEERFIAFEAKEVASEAGKASFSFTPHQSGRYLVRVATTLPLLSATLTR